jgi:hypothetical protein
LLRRYVAAARPAADFTEQLRGLRVVLGFF